MHNNTTESNSHHDELETKSAKELCQLINGEDQTVAHSVAKEMDAIATLSEQITRKLKAGGRLFYIGSGTSGRLGIVDASECPPTYGVPHGKVVGIIAGGDGAIRKAVEHAEDDTEQAWKDLKAHQISSKDIVVGISASGKTPYVLGGLKKCKENGIETGSISCNKNTPISSVATYPIEVITGPEFVTGSTRMKAGTAQKLVLNMLTTSVMIQLGHVEGNKMVDMQLSNNKLVKRGTEMVMQQLGIDFETAEELLLKHGSVRKAVIAYQQ